MQNRTTNTETKQNIKNKTKYNFSALSSLSTGTQYPSEFNKLVGPCI